MLQYLLALINKEPVDFSLINSNQLLLAAKMHRVVGLVYRALLTYSCAPSALLQQFKIENQLNQCIALQQMQQLMHINQLFKQNNIPMLCFKGLLLSQRLHGDIAVRQSKDIDILVPQAAVITANNLLLENGYQAIDAPELNSYTIKSVFFNHKELYYKHVSGVHLELHWRFHTPYIMALSFEELWQHKLETQLHGEIFYTLGLEHEWLYLCMHGSKHLWKRLQWLCDLAFSMRFLSETEKKFIAKAQEYGMLKNYHLALFLAKKHFPLMYPQHFTEVYRPPILCDQAVQFCMKIPDEESNVNMLLKLIVCNFIMAKGWKSKGYFLLDPVCKKFLFKWNEKKLPKSLFFICYLYYYCGYLPMRLIIKIFQYRKEMQ